MKQFNNRRHPVAHFGFTPVCRGHRVDDVLTKFSDFPLSQSLSTRFFCRGEPSLYYLIGDNGILSLLLP